MRSTSRRMRPHVVTLYNFNRTEGGVASYQRTVLRHVQLDTGFQQKLGRMGVQTEDAATLILDLSDYEATDGRAFVIADVWKRMTVEQRAHYFTLGASDDFFVEGDAPETLPAETKATMQKLHRCYAISKLGMPPAAGKGPVLLEVIGR